MLHQCVYFIYLFCDAVALCWHRNSKDSTGHMVTASSCKITGLETLLSSLCINKAGLVTSCSTKKNVGFEPRVVVGRGTRMKGRKDFHTTLELCNHGKSNLNIIIVAIAVDVVLFSREHKTQIKS